MSQARTELLSRHACLKACLNDSSVQDGTPIDTQKNMTAAMFRNGLAVLAFSMTEAFIRDRTAEVLGGFSNISLRFSDLSEKLQAAATIHALKAVIFRAGLKDKPDQISWALAQLPVISASTGNISKLSPYAFGQNKSNISHEDISDILSAFGIEGGWSAVSTIAKRIGLGGIPDYGQMFKDMAKKRHLAAHEATANIPINDLTDSATAIIAICCSFDLLLSHSLSIHNTGRVPNKLQGMITASSIKLRFLSPHPSKSGIFQEQIENRHLRRTIKNHASIQLAEQSCSQACAAQHQQLIQLGANSTPERWRSWL